MNRTAPALLICLLSLIALTATGCNTTSEERIAAAQVGVEVAEQRFRELDAALDAIDATIATLQVRLEEADPESELFHTVNAKIDELRSAAERDELVEARAIAKRTLADAREALERAEQDPGIASELDAVGTISGGLSSVGGPVGAGFAALSGVLGVVAEFLRRRKKEDEEALGEAAESADLSKLSPKAKKTVRRASGKQV